MAKEELYLSVEKAFSSYVKSCMTFMSRNFLKCMIKNCIV